MPGLNSGNAIADLLLAGTVYGTGELVTNPNVQQRWHDLEFYVADSYKVAPRWTVDFGMRFSHMQPPFMADDRMGNFVLSSVNPALGDSSCNGIEYPPGTNPCTALGIPGGSDGPNRQLVPTQFLWFAPRLGVAWDVNGNGKMAIRAGIGRFYQRDRVSPGLGVGTSPPFSGSASVTRTLDSAASVTGATTPGYGAASNALEQEASNSNYWQWNVAVEKEVWANTKVEVAYVGSKGLDLFGQTNLNEVAPANRLAYAQTGNQALRPLNGTASIGDGNLAMWQHNRDSIYHSLQVAFASRFGNNSVLAASYTWAKLISNTGVGNADGPGLSYNNAYTDSTQPDLERSRGANDRTHSFNASLVLGLPKFEDKGAFVKNVFGDWEFTSIVQAGTGYPITVNIGSVPGLYGNGIAGNRDPAAASRDRTWSRDRVARRTAPTRPVAQPGRLDAQRLPDRHLRERWPQHLRRPQSLPGGRVRVQEHQTQRAGEAPAPVRGVQPLQPEQLHQRPVLQLRSGQRRVRHRVRKHGHPDHQRDAHGQLRAAQQRPRPADGAGGHPPDVLGTGSTPGCGLRARSPALPQPQWRGAGSSPAPRFVLSGDALRSLGGGSGEGSRRSAPEERVLQAEEGGLGPVLLVEDERVVRPEDVLSIQLWASVKPHSVTASHRGTATHAATTSR